jgi:hypothetical protein
MAETEWVLLCSRSRSLKWLLFQRFRGDLGPSHFVVAAARRAAVSPPSVILSSQACPGVVEGSDTYPKSDKRERRAQTFISRRPSAGIPSIW